MKDIDRKDGQIAATVISFIFVFVFFVPAILFWWKLAFALLEKLP